MKSWLLIGASGHAMALASVINRRAERIAAIADRSLSEQASLEDLAPVFRSASSAEARLFSDDLQALAAAREHGWNVAIGIGYNSVRLRLAQMVMDAGLEAEQLTALVAPSASVDVTAQLGPLVQVLEHAHIGPMTRVGFASLINTGAIVEHESSVGAGAHVAPTATMLGATGIGDLVFLGSGARVLPGLRVGEGSIVGAGAVITNEVPAGTVFAGVPARQLKKLKGTS